MMPIRCRVQRPDGEPFDVSALSDIDVLHALNVAKDREPALLSAAAGDVPPGWGYALLERFVQLFEAKNSRPFEL